MTGRALLGHVSVWGVCFVIAISLLCAGDRAEAYAMAQDVDVVEQKSGSSVTLVNARTERWQMGVKVRAQGATTGIVATLPVPKAWPEQQVKIVDRQQSRNVRTVRIRELEEGVQEMSVIIPRLLPGDEATATITMEIVKSDIAAPVDTGALSVPKRVSRNMSKYLKSSPYINTRDQLIQQAVREVVAGKESGWEQAEAIYDWVREKIEYRFDRNAKSARQALDDGFGDCEEMTSLFIAMCRMVKIPARAVWVPDHCYPEFYLVDQKGKGHWYPCQAAGTRSFGAMPEARPVLQKGDSFRVPGHAQPQRYYLETLTAKNAAAPPLVEFSRKKLQ